MMAEVRVNPSFHRFLIGRNGVNLREISERTGARIVFPSQSDHDNDCILIIGQQDSIGRAKAELESRIKDLVFLLIVRFIGGIEHVAGPSVRLCLVQAPNL